VNYCLGVSAEVEALKGFEISAELQEPLAVEIS